MSRIEYRGTLVCSINVSDLDRSVRWYRDGLGFEEIYRMNDYGWCEMRSPIDGVTIGLQRTESGFGPGGATLSFTVADIEAARKHCNPRERALTARLLSYRATMVSGSPTFSIPTAIR